MRTVMGNLQPSLSLSSAALQYSFCWVLGGLIPLGGGRGSQYQMVNTPARRLVMFSHGERVSVQVQKERAGKSEPGHDVGGAVSVEVSNEDLAIQTKGLVGKQ